RSSQNALKTGLYAEGITIGYESSDQLEHLIAQFNAEYLPVTPTERSLVDQLIHCEWMLRRFRWLETELWKTATKKLSSEDYCIPAPASAFLQEPGIARLYRQRNAMQKQFRETLAELRRVRAERNNVDPPEMPPQPRFGPPDPSDVDETTPTSEQLAS